MFYVFKELFPERKDNSYITTVMKQILKIEHETGLYLSNLNDRIVKGDRAVLLDLETALPSNASEQDKKSLRNECEITSLF